MSMAIAFIVYNDVALNELVCIAQLLLGVESNESRHYPEYRARYRRSPRSPGSLLRSRRSLIVDAPLL